MKLHTRLTGTEVRAALQRAKAEGLITPDIRFVTWTPGRSLTHPHGYEIQLGTYDKRSLPAGTRDQHGRAMHVRRFKNTGRRGAASDSAWAGNDESVWAATWFEWGWFIAEIFEADPDARWGADPARCASPSYAWGYASPEDFHAKTGGVFRQPERTSAS